VTLLETAKLTTVENEKVTATAMTTVSEIVIVTTDGQGLNGVAT
jgi:hypothetical protein